MTERGRRKMLKGIVLSNAAEKTVVIKVERRIPHPRYKKMVRKSKKFMAHDERNDCGIGDKVQIIESRPLSARKRWRVVDIIERAR